MGPRKAEDLLQADPFDAELCQRFGFSLANLTAYSVHWLTVWEIPTTYENISVLNARLFPTEFSLAGFPTLPDAMRTNRTLLQMRPKYRGLATSDPRRGVFLTEKGREAAGQVLQNLGVPTFEGRRVEQPAQALVRLPTAGRERTRNPVQILTDSKDKLLFRRYREGRFDETEIVHLLGLLSLYDHTPPAEVRKSFRQLRVDAQTAGDAEFSEFLDRVEERFAGYLNRTDAKGG